MMRMLRMLLIGVSAFVFLDHVLSFHAIRAIPSISRNDFQRGQKLSTRSVLDAARMKDAASNDESDWVTSEFTLLNLQTEPSPELSAETVAIACA